MLQNLPVVEYRRCFGTNTIIEVPLQDEEARLISRVDQVFIHSPALMERKGHLNPETTFLPNGVDYQSYTAIYDEPVDLQRLPHPRIGCIGKIKKHLDFTLLLALAKRHQHWSSVFVGLRLNTGNGASFMQELSHAARFHSVRQISANARRVVASARGCP